MSGGWTAFVWWVAIKNKAVLEIITTPASQVCVAKIIGAQAAMTTKTNL
jgi:hypothetical protein